MRRYTIDNGFSVACNDVRGGVMGFALALRTATKRGRSTFGVGGVVDCGDRLCEQMMGKKSATIEVAGVDGEEVVSGKGEREVQGRSGRGGRVLLFPARAGNGDCRRFSCLRR